MGTTMKARIFILSLAVVLAALPSLAPREAQAQSAAGAFLGGVLGGVIGGAIANAHARPVVIRERTRVVRVARPAQRRVAARPARTGSPTGAALISTSADPFAKSAPPATVAVTNAR